VTADPPALVAAATHKDGRLAPLGRALDEFFGSLGPRPATGDTEARAAGRRARVIDTVPETLRPMVTAFSAAELSNRERARRSDGRLLTDQTLLIHLEVVADFSRHTPDLADWATVAQGDIEAFLACRSPVDSYSLPSLRAFFSWARTQRRILVDPTANLRNRLQRRFSGPVVDLATQRRLFRRWTTEVDLSPTKPLSACSRSFTPRRSTICAISPFPTSITPPIPSLLWLGPDPCPSIPHMGRTAGLACPPQLPQHHQPSCARQPADQGHRPAGIALARQ